MATYNCTMDDVLERRAQPQVLALAAESTVSEPRSRRWCLHPPGPFDTEPMSLGRCLHEPEPFDAILGREHRGPLGRAATSEAAGHVGGVPVRHP